MSDGVSIPITEEGIQKVKNYIEQCLTKYMTKKEAANNLFLEKKIEPRLTETVWNLLEQENQEFFKAYYTRLALKEQIERFNTLLEQQAALMGHPGFSKDSTEDASDNAPKMPSMQPQLPGGSIMVNEELVPMPEETRWQNSSSLNDVFINAASYTHGVHVHNNFNIQFSPVIHDPSRFGLLQSSVGMEWNPQYQNGAVNQINGFWNSTRIGMVDNHTSFLPQDMANFHDYNHNGANENQVDNSSSNKEPACLRFKNPFEGTSNS